MPVIRCVEVRNRDMGRVKDVNILWMWISECKVWISECKV